MASDKTEWLSIKQNGYLNTMAINRKYWLSIEQNIISIAFICRSAGFIDSAASYATLFWAQYLHCKGVYLLYDCFTLFEVLNYKYYTAQSRTCQFLQNPDCQKSKNNSENDCNMKDDCREPDTESGSHSESGSSCNFSST